MTPDPPGGPGLGNLWGPEEPTPDTVPSPGRESPGSPSSPPSLRKAEFVEQPHLLHGGPPEVGPSSFGPSPGPWVPSSGPPVPVGRPQVPPAAVVVAVVGVLVLATAVLVGARKGQEDTSIQAGATASASVSVAPFGGEPGGTTADGANVSAEARAVQQLDALRNGDLATVAIDGQWVAQLASKYVGITDPHQTTTSGSNTFAATDILAEHQALRGGDNHGARVVLLLSTDYGKQQMINGHALWVTFALGDFASASDVEVWCAGRFPGLDSVALTNACTPRTLKPPGS